MLPSLLEMAVQLDSMDRDVTSWEADFLSSNLPRLRAGDGLSIKQEKALRDMYRKYFHADTEQRYSADDQEDDGQE